MNPTTPGGSARLWVGVVTALLAGVLGARGARAEGCAARHDLRAGVANFDLLTSRGALAAPDGALPAIPISPCAGLKCSAGDPIPPSPSGPVPTLRPERWGLWANSATTTDSGAFLSFRDEAAVLPAATAQALFRPPRAR